MTRCLRCTIVASDLRDGFCPTLARCDEVLRQRAAILASAFTRLFTRETPSEELELAR